jgi:hypothetical protein
MARYFEPTPEQEQAWKDWVTALPEPARAVTERFEPWGLYRMTETGHRVTIYSTDEKKDGRIRFTVDVSGEFNHVSMNRRVFDVDPDTLVPCELPLPGEKLGTELADPAEIETYVDLIRPIVLAERERLQGRS